MNLALRNKKLIFYLVFLLVITNLQGAKINYPVSEIPDSLLKDAKSVIRKNLVEFQLRDLNNTVMKRVIAVTILDRSAVDHGAHTFRYDKDQNISSIRATLYNQFGIPVRQFDRKDFYDFSYDTYGSIYSDARALSLSGNYTEFPYTLEFEITMHNNNSYSFVNWHALEQYDQSLQYGMLKITVPADYFLRYREKSFPNPVSVNQKDNTQEYTWEIDNIPAIEYEPYAPPFKDRAPGVRVSPSIFQYGKYTGDMSSWKDFGSFVNELNNGRDDISEELITKMRSMVAGIDDPVEKARIVYDYLQNNTRYVSIQVGIGGLQPFPASTVENYGYGDCKALTNYMQTLLKAVGVEAHYALIEAGKYQYEYDTSFVHDPYNHIILCLPSENKDIWLECTSQMIPFGFLGDFTDNRYALVIDANGGILKKTTSYADNISKLTRTAEVFIDGSDKSGAKVSTTYTGLYYDDILRLLHADYERQKDYLYNNHIAIPDFKINNFEFNDHRGIFPSASEYLDLSLIKYCTVSGSRIFIPANLMNRFEGVPRKDDERKNPVRILKDYMEYDTVFFHLPDNYIIENIPENTSIESKFGKFSAFYEKTNEGIRYTRSFEINRAEYPKEQYNAFVNFCRSISKADKQKIVLVKDEN